MVPPASRRRVTVHDVASRAGVSQPTASLVLSNHPTARVAAATRERVQQAAAELGYRPNVVARSLASRRSFTLGVIIPDLRNPFFADVVVGAERVAQEAGYAVLLCDQSARDVRAHLETLRARQIDGVLLDAVGAASLDPGALAEINVALIDEPSDRWPGVATDAVGAGRAAAEHLLAHGHRELAFIGPATDVYTFRMRERGFVMRLREAGLRISSDRLRRAAPTVEGGRESMRRLLAGARPTAVFCANDLMAIGALKQSLASGLRLPHDLSLVGCDDIELARYVTPELTTVSVPARELGARAARLLIGLLDGSRGTSDRVGRAAARDPGRSATRMLPVRFVARGTSGPVPPESAA